MNITIKKIAILMFLSFYIATTYADADKLREGHAYRGCSLSKIVTTTLFLGLTVYTAPIEALERGSSNRYMSPWYSEVPRWSEKAWDTCADAYKAEHLRYFQPLGKWSSIDMCVEEKVTPMYEEAIHKGGKEGTVAKYLKAKQYFRHSNISKYLSLLGEAAQEGMDEAQYELGGIYWVGVFEVEMSKEKGLELFKLATEQGHPIAARYVISAYLTGEGGVSPDENIAIEWSKKSVRGNLSDALYRIGIVYEESIYLPRDMDKAKKWYTQAAEKGSHEAQERLEKMGRSLSWWPWG